MTAAPSVLLDHGGHSFIAFATGRKWLYAVALGQPVTIVRLPREIPPLPATHGYTASKNARQMKQAVLP